MKNVISFIFLLTLLVSGCSQEEMSKLGTSSTSKGRVFTTSFEQNDSRTYVEDGHLSRWTEGDRISIFDASTLNCQYLFAGDTGDSGGTFFMLSKPEGTGTALSTNYAVYPYSENVKMTEDGVISVTLPSEQHYAENSYGLGDNTMVAVTEDADDTFLSFKNVGGCLKLQLYGDDVTVKSITLMGNNGEKIAGKATLTAAYGKVPVVTMADDATISITLDCGEKGVKIGSSAEDATAFWMVVPPTTFEKGITVKIMDMNGKMFIQKTEKQLVIERNVVKPMAAIKAVMTENVESEEPASEYQIFEVEKDGMDAIITSNGQYAFLKETPKKDALMLVIGRCGIDEQFFVQFDGEGYLKSMTFDEKLTITFFYTPNGVCIINENNEILGEIPYSDFSEIINDDGQTRASSLSRSEFMLKLDFLCKLIDNVNLLKEVGEAVFKKSLKTKTTIELIRTCADYTGIPSNYIVDSVDALLGLALDYNKYGRLCEIIDMVYDYKFFGWASVNAYSVIKDNMEVEFVSEVKDLTANFLNWAKGEYGKNGEVLDYTYTVGVNIYDNPTTLTPIQTDSKAIVGNGKESLNFIVDKKYEKYYCEPYLKVEGTMKIDRDDIVRARVNIAPAYKMKLSNLGPVLGKFERTLYGDRDYFMYDYNLRKALEKLYESTNGDSWSNNNNWCSNRPIIDWYGVREGHTDNKSFIIDLNGNGLTGKIDQTLPNDIKINLWVGNNQLTAVDVPGSTSLLSLHVNHMQTLMTSVDVSGCTALEPLYCAESQITSLNASNCKSLKNLTIGNQMSLLNVSGCTELTNLDCNSIQLASLNVSGCTGLTKLSCNLNQLISLDVSDCTALTELSCYLNKLTSLKVAGCTKLTKMDCGGNQFTSLDISTCTALKELNCNSSCQLTSLDVSKCTALTFLDCGYSPQFTTLKVSGHTSLKTLYCHYNGQLSSLDVSGCTALTYLYCNSTQLTYLNASRCTSLKDLVTYGVTSLDVSGCTAITDLLCSYQKMVSLNVTGCKALKRLDVHHNQLSSLDVSTCTALTALSCSNNQIFSLDVSGHTSLKFLSCDASTVNASGCTSLTSISVGNETSTLDISDCTSMEIFSCTGNLSSFKFSGCTSLKKLYVNSNQLASLDVSNLKSLENLSCDGNPLVSLNVSGCTALKDLSCGWCQLITLNVSGCTALTELFCPENGLVSLNVAGCKSLSKIFCQKNNLASIDVSSCKSLSILNCSDNNITAEIPEWFSQFTFVHDEKYTYRKEQVNGKWVTVHDDNGVGWWYPGEPEKGKHSPD